MFSEMFASSVLFVGSVSVYHIKIKFFEQEVEIKCTKTPGGY